MDPKLNKDMLIGIEYSSNKEDNKSKSYQLNKLGQNTYKPQKT